MACPLSSHLDGNGEEEYRGLIETVLVIICQIFIMY